MDDVQVIPTKQVHYILPVSTIEVENNISIIMFKDTIHKVWWQNDKYKVLTWAALYVVETN